tara:strand:- start:6089 stop:6625 length:537 start_codon:yes stop_codon:yes gene_type:complete
MSRIGKQPVPVPDSVNVVLNDQLVIMKGNKGSLDFQLHPDITVKKEKNELIVERSSDGNEQMALHGTSRAILANMVIGVSDGYEKELEIIGVGYSANLQGKMLKLVLGYSHDIYFTPPEGIAIKATKNSINVSGIDKQLVGQVAAKIRSFRKPEPYKGKGLRYKGEYVKIKKGKTIGE